MTVFSKRLLLSTALTRVGALALGIAAGGNEAYALPQQGQVVGGSASIAQAGPSELDITQSSSRAVIDWRSFSIGAGETTRFIQPDSSSVAVNRVTGVDPSSIMGRLTANGQVVLVNPNGILFGKGAAVNVGGLVASTAGISTQNAMNGIMVFDRPGQAGATIRNDGTITARTGGLVALVAPNVVNDGIISAKLGKVSLSSGDKWTLDLYGDNLVSFDVTDQVNGSVTNNGVVKAGTVALTANAAKGIVGNAINMGGVIEATAAHNDGGTIILDGGANGDVSVTGRLVARGATGGTVEVTGNTVALTGATVDASGAKGGGTIAVGGGPQGTGSLHHAQTVTVDAATKLVVDALDQGNGGAITVWSDGETDFAGDASARGGSAGGNGGSIETSGHVLAISGGHIDTSAAHGTTGNWLLDPYDLSINASGASAIDTALATSNVTVQTTAATSGTSSTSSYGTAVSGAGGNISVNSAISWSSANSLTLSAYNSILINANITDSAAGTVVLRADNTGVGTATLGAGGGSVTNSATVSTAGAISLYYDPSGGYTSPSTYTGLTGTAGVTKYMLVDTAANLTSVSTNLSGTYALGNNITVGGAFTALGTSATPFSGLFDGNGGIASYSISGATVTGTSYVGLFGSNSGIIRNLTVGTGTIIGTSNVGGLVGYNTGTLLNNTVISGIISGNDNVGGLVGYTEGNTSQITGNTVLAGITLSTSAGTAIGGLVGYNGVGSTISGDTALEAVTGNSTVGGYVGYNAGLVTGITATNNVSVLGDITAVGGLVGLNASTGTVLSSAARNTVTLDQNDGLTGNYDIGGLIGHNDGFVSAVSAVGSINSTSYIDNNVGGLIGYDDDTGSLSNLFANETIQTNGSSNIGGMFGYLTNTGGVSNATVLGSITIYNYAAAVGGFGGEILSNISNIGVTENLNINAGYNIGGVAGGLGNNASTPTIGANVSYNGLISTSDGLSNIGGLVGESVSAVIKDGTVNASIITQEDVSNVGGLVGLVVKYGSGGIIVGGTVNASIIVGTTSANIGGYVGNNANATISQGIVLASTTISAGSGSSAIGGLVGYNGENATISGGMALEAVTGATQVGGYVGYNAGLVTGVTATNNVFGLGDVTAIGGLIGLNASTGTVLSSAARNTVTLDQNDGLTGNYDIGGLIGHNDGFVSAVSAIGSINSTGFTDTNIGGLIGYDDDTGSLSNLYANETIQTNGGYNIGGMFGYLTNAGGVSDATVLGNIAIGNYAGNVGGFAGQVASNINNINVTDNLYIENGFNIGGVAGGLGSNASTLTIGANVSYSGLITTSDGLSNIGGLVGESASSVITDGTVNASIITQEDVSNVGGLVGLLVNYGSGGVISGGTVNASITVGTTSANIGGLVGNNANGTITQGTVLASTTISADSGSSAIGGLVGYNDANATVSGGTALEAVTGATQIGGFVGYNAGLVTGIAAINNVTGNASSTTVGGIVGYNIGTVTASSYAGTVAAGTGSFAVGGLAGFNSSAGTVTGDTGTGTVTAGTGSTFVHAVNHIGCDETAGCAGTAGQQAITVTGGAVSGTYGTAVGTVGYTPSGTLESGDSYAGLLSGNLAAPGTAAGTYAIGQGSLALTGPYAALDYTIDYVAGTETIAKATLTVTATSESKTYGASDPTLAYTASGYQYSDGSGIISGALGRAAGENAGSYAIGLNTLSAGSNYTISLVGNNLTITKAQLIITPTGSQTYGGSNVSVSYAYSGLVNGDTSGAISGVGSSTTVTNGSNAGTYGITATGGTTSNYTITDATGVYTVDDANLVITANNATRQVGQSDPVFTASFAGLVNGDMSSVVTGLSFVSTDQTNSSAGSYTITASGGTASNYLISYVAGTLAVTAGSGSPPPATPTPPDPAPAMPVSVAPAVASPTSSRSAISDISNPILAQVVNNQIFQMPSSDIVVTSSRSLGELVVQGVIEADPGSLQGVATHGSDDDRIICLKNSGISSGCESPIKLQSIR